jgi:translocation and assembly module TamB
LHTLKGIFSFAGKDFKITTGDVIFSENGSFINIAANLQLPDLTVTVLFRGTLQNPQLIFQSTPPLPTSTILARILFNKDVSELSTSQIVQLATTIMTLSSSSTPDILGTLRRNLGIDRLSISANEKGKFSVEIGKSLSTNVVKGVVGSLVQDTDTSHVKVEVELKGGFLLGAETQEDDQGKFSFKWNKNY